MPKQQLCIESTCILGASEDVRVWQEMGLGDEAEQHETKNYVHTEVINVAGQCHGEVNANDCS